MAKIYLVRHGQTDYNVKKVYYGSTDCPMNEIGIKQSLNVQNLMKSVHFDKVYVSPLIRAKKTAEIVLDGKDISLIEEPRLRELDFGQWEGVGFDELLDDEHWQKWSKDWVNVAPTGGESFAEGAVRIREFYDELISYLSTHDENVVIFGHNLSMMLFMSMFLKLEPESCWHFSFEQGAHTLVELVDGFPVIKYHNLYKID